MHHVIRGRYSGNPPFTLPTTQQQSLRKNQAFSADAIWNNPHSWSQEDPPKPPRHSSQGRDAPPHVGKATTQAHAESSCFIFIGLSTCFLSFKFLPFLSCARSFLVLPFLLLSSSFPSLQVFGIGGFYARFFPDFARGVAPARQKHDVCAKRPSSEGSWGGVALSQIRLGWTRTLAIRVAV